MNAFRIGITLPAQASEGFELEKAVPVFHKWIQGQALAGHLLIDVADYMHVEDGPGVVLVSHEANIGLQKQHGQCDLVYLRKRPFGNAFSDRLETVLRSTLSAASLLQSALPDLKFAANRFQLRIVDKLSAPNNAETLRTIQPDVESVFGKIFDQPVRVEHHPNPLKHFEVTVETGSSLGLTDAVQRASVTTAT